MFYAGKLINVISFKLKKYGYKLNINFIFYIKKRNIVSFFLKIINYISNIHYIYYSSKIKT